MMNLASGPPRLVAGRFWVIAALAAVVVLGAAGTSGAASPSITVCPSPTSGTLTCGSIPGDGIAVPYFTTAQPTYIRYTVAFRRGSDNNTLTHARISDPVGSPLGSCGASSPGCPDAQFAGATVVSVLGTLTVGTNPATTFCTTENAVYRGTTAFPKQGVSCPLGSLPPNSTVVLTVVFQVPKQADAGGATALVNQAALFVDESLNDAQPSSSHQDTFPTTTVTNPLTTDVANVFNTYTLPNTSGSFQTNGSGGTGNYQQSAVSWSGTIGFPGGGLQLQECGGPTSLSGSPPCAAPTNPCGALTCTTQTSLVVVPGSATSFFTLNPMTITLTFFASELPAKFNLSQFVIYHDGFPVSSCKAKTLTDPSGDCVLSLTQSKTPPLDVTAVITGPANGGWGGI
jgi:hypothetical protein